MAGAAGRDRFVIGRLGGAAGIAAGHFEHAVELAEDGLDAPEAPAGKDRLGALGA